MGDLVSDGNGDLDFELYLKFLMDDPEACSLLFDIETAVPSPVVGDFEPVVSAADRVTDEFPHENDASPGCSGLTWTSDLEKLLFDDDEVGAPEGVGEEAHADFFSEIAGADCRKEDSSSCDGDRIGKTSESDEAARDAEDVDPTCKKRIRQIRNRESALKSRERKKMYVKDLEMKARFLESECRRLGFALQYYTSENLMLRKSLQQRAFDSPAARQESAVLFVESLPLGSLFWLLSVICLFLALLLPPGDRLQPSNVLLEAAVLARPVLAMGRSGEARPDPELNWVCLGLSRRCRGAKKKMKIYSVSGMLVV